MTRSDARRRLIWLSCEEMPHTPSRHEKCRRECFMWELHQLSLQMFRCQGCLPRHDESGSLCRDKISRSRRVPRILSRVFQVRAGANSKQVFPVAYRATRKAMSAHRLMRARLDIRLQVEFEL